MYTEAWNVRQRARLARVYLPSAEGEELAAMISFKKLIYLPTIHKELRNHLMKLMVFVVITKGNNIIHDYGEQRGGTLRQA